MEATESARDAAVREVSEELGLRLTEQLHELGVLGGSPSYTVDYPDWGPTTYEVTMFVTVVRRRLDVVLATAEIADARWVAVSEVDRIELARDMEEIVPVTCAWYSALTSR